MAVKKKKKTPHTKDVYTAVTKYCQAIEVLDWLKVRGDYYCGAKRQLMAFWYAVTNPSFISEDEAQIAAEILFFDGNEDGVSIETAMRFRAEEIRNLHGRDA
jgi:hypothetical protein